LADQENQPEIQIFLVDPQALQHDLLYHQNIVGK
jgi:hypothetical protein